jgi:hypothetical protein
MNPLILKLFEECKDAAYLVRFLDYIMSSRYPRVKFSLNGLVAEPLISGSIRITQTNKEVSSLGEFYEVATNNTKVEDLERVLKNVCGTDGDTLWMILGRVNEDEIVNFVDQKYRAFLVYKDLEGRIAPTTNSGYVPKRLLIKWESMRFYISRSGIEDYLHTDVIVGPIEKFRFLSAYEASECGDNLWFYVSEDKEWMRLL